MIKYSNNDIAFGDRSISTALTMLFYEYGLQARLHEDWSLSKIFAVISKGNPIIADIFWDPSIESLGHFVVIYGVDLNQQVLYYHDPYCGSEMTAYCDDFAIKMTSISK